MTREDEALFFRRAEEWKRRLEEASGPWGGADICAVTKTRSARDANLAIRAGIRAIGENRVQELMEKVEALDPGYEIHMIGRLQTNKVKYLFVSARVSMIQSLDRDELALEIERQAQKAGRDMSALVQVNLASEAQKGGIAEEEIIPFIRRTAALDGVRIRGLMAVMPQAEDPETLRPLFRRMRLWFDRLRQEAIPGASMEILSMGMSGDCLVAAQEGATMVRLGTALFGRREVVCAGGQDGGHAASASDT